MKIMGRFAVLFMLIAAPAQAAEPHAYRAARLWPGDGPAISDAVLLVRDGKIVAVGKRADVTIPADAVIHDLGDAVIIPGLIAAETTLAERGRDDLHALTPHYRAIDGFDWYADLSSPLSGGVTTVQIAPGARRLLPGQGAVVKLFGDDPQQRTVRETESLRVLFGDVFKNPPRIYEPPVGPVSVDRPLEPTRPQLGGSLASAVAGLRASFAAARAGQDPRDPFLRAVGGYGSSKQPLRVFTPSAADVHAALTLAREFDLRLILVEPPVAKDKLANWKPHVESVILNTKIRPGAVTEDGSAGVPAAEARDLRAAGFRVAIKPANDADLKELHYLGSFFTSHLSPAEALRMLTADAAALLGVADRVGTLSIGRDADFVVLSGEPFALQSRIRSVYVDGEPAVEAKPAGTRKIVRAGKILTGSGDVIVDGSILIDGQSIRSVGRDVSTPADAEERKFANAVIVPGFIDLNTNIGVGGPISAAIPFTTKLGDRLLSGDAAAKSVRQAGLTTVLLSGPAPASVLAFKLGDRLRPVKEPVALRFAVRGNLTSAGQSLRDTLRTGKNYADSWNKYEAELPAYEIKKKEFDAYLAKTAAENKDEKKPEDKKPDDKKPEDKKPEEKKPEEKKPEEKKLERPKSPDKPQVNEGLEPYRALFAGKIPALVEARREDAVRLAVTICRDEFNIRTALTGADDIQRIGELLASKNVAVVAGPDLLRTVEREEVNLPLTLAVHGVPFGFQSNAAAGAKNLPQAVGFAVHHGLSGSDALKGLTVSAAQLLGLDQVGALAAGKDADLVVLSGMPFEPATRVLAVMIDGQWVYRAAE